jgi:lambda repressor-like predicted transcriptional regulator
MQGRHIQAELYKKGSGLTDIAKSFEPHISLAAVKRVIENKTTSERIRQKIADTLNTTIEKLWPEAA